MSFMEEIVWKKFVNFPIFHKPPTILESTIVLWRFYRLIHSNPTINIHPSLVNLEYSTIGRKLKLSLKPILMINNSNGSFFMKFSSPEMQLCSNIITQVTQSKGRIPNEVFIIPIAILRSILWNNMFQRITKLKL